MQFSSRQLEEEEKEERRRRHYLEKIEEEEGGEYGPSHSSVLVFQNPPPSSGNEMVSFRGKDTGKKNQIFVICEKDKRRVLFSLIRFPPIIWGDPRAFLIRSEREVAIFLSPSLTH